MEADELEPLMPNRAGVKMGFMTYVRLIMLILPRIHLLFISNRPSVVDARVDQVSPTSPTTF